MIYTPWRWLAGGSALLCTCSMTSVNGLFESNALHFTMQSLKNSRILVSIFIWHKVKRLLVRINREQERRCLNSHEYLEIIAGNHLPYKHGCGDLKKSHSNFTSMTLPSGRYITNRLWTKTNHEFTTEQLVGKLHPSTGPLHHSSNTFHDQCIVLTICGFV